MQVTARQRRALAAICDTFAPGVDGLPPASEVGVAGAFLEAVARHPRAAERNDVLRLLTVWELAARPGRRFSSLPLVERERVLRRWRDSRFGRRRAAYKVLRKGILHHYFGLPSAARDALGYPGPADVKPRPSSVEPISVNGDLELACDVCVVGSGTGGATAAGILAEAGLDVVVLEAGGDGRPVREEIEALRALYLEAAAAATDDQALDFLAGACLGGGATVNWTTCLRPPDDVLAEWETYGLPIDEVKRSVDAVWARLDVNGEHSRASGRDALLERGLRALGWHVAAQQRNVRGCEQGRICGTCAFGCPLGAKRTPLVAWVAGTEVRVLARTRAERVLAERGAAAGVEARAAGGHRVRVRSRAVFVACGAFQTPALLVRSGLASGSIGRNLRFHPVTLVAGEFDEEVRPWEGPLQSRYSEEHARLDGGYGVRYETAPVHPGLLGAALPWDGARESLDLARRFPHLVPVFPLVRDRDGGKVVVGKDGEPAARYALSRYDLRHVRAGFVGAARILEAAGARRIISTHARPVVWEPAKGGGAGRFLAEADARGWEANRVLYASAHVLGTARMGASPAASACDPDGETWEVARLVVCDGSALPTASGVNPMITIAALAHLNASKLAAKLA